MRSHATSSVTRRVAVCDRAETPVRPRLGCGGSTAWYTRRARSFRRPGPRPGGVLVFRSTARMLPTEPSPPGHHDRGPVRGSMTRRPRWASSATGATTSSRSSTRRWPGATCASSCRPSTSPSSATLDEALALPIRPDAPADRHRADRRQAPAGLADGRSSRRSPPVSTSMSGLHTFLGDDPEFAAAAAAARDADHRLPPAARPDGDGRRPAARARQAGDPDRRHRLRDRQDVGGARARRRGAGATVHRPSSSPTGQTGMMIEGWGVAVDRRHQRLRPGHRRVARRAGRGAWRLGPRRGPGSLDHPAYCAVTLALIHGATPHAMVLVHKPGLAEHDFDHLPDASFPIAAAAGRSSTSTSGSRGWSHRRGSWRSRSTPRSTRMTARRGGSSSGSPPRPGCPPTTRSASAPTGCGRRSASRGRPAMGRRRCAQTHEVLSLRAARPVPDRPRGPWRRACGHDGHRRAA